MLALIERQLIAEIDRRRLREVQPAQSLLPPVQVKWILRAGNRGSARDRREDFARIVQGLAIGERETAGETVQIANAKFILQAVIGRPCCIFAFAEVREIAVRAPTGEAWCARGRTRCNTRRNKGGKVICNQSCKRRIAIHRLEVAIHAITNIAGLKHYVARKLVLNPE